MPGDAAREARLVVVDVGNTDIKMGCWDGRSITERRRMPLSSAAAPDAATRLFEPLALLGRDLGPVCIASVVPWAAERVARAAEQQLRTTTAIISTAAPLPLHIDVERPEKVGVDRLANALGALAMKSIDWIVVDAGTAMTVDYVTGDRRFLGGAILPGPATALQALIQRSEQLPGITLGRAERAIGRTTEAAMRSGIVIGAAGAVDGLVRRMRQEIGTSSARVVATGGFAPMIAGESEAIQEVDEDLTLRGVAVAAGSMGLAG